MNYQALKEKYLEVETEIAKERIKEYQTEAEIKQKEIDNKNRYEEIEHHEDWINHYEKKIKRYKTGIKDCEEMLKWHNLEIKRISE